MPNPVVHFEIQSTDADKTRSFFSDVFDWKINVVPEIGYGVVEKQADHGIGGGISDAAAGQTCVTFYIEVDGIQDYLDKAVAAGGEVVMPVTSIPDAVTLALFADPTGAIVGLVDSESSHA